ncbi:hypothetical protein [Pseudoxanthomonas sp. PXM02]|uniref:hypothetical protein n=1 Tax=Pseudoxanthomonas sp. PXM02 TaxID=2769294 RepID=UPI0017837AA0|nr:hypothetical protein [Pseudoxanthomonas sp. PXM02]MBD9480757.1 hypothetical protein [Pseudoxanthomonas sp. PXM02]
MKHLSLTLAMAFALATSMLAAAPAARSQTVDTGYMVCVSQNRPAGKSFVSDIAEVRYVTTHVENWNSDKFREMVSSMSTIPKEALYTSCSRRRIYEEAYNYRQRVMVVNAREGMPAMQVSYLPRSEPGY